MKPLYVKILAALELKPMSSILLETLQFFIVLTVLQINAKGGGACCQKNMLSLFCRTHCCGFKAFEMECQISAQFRKNDQLWGS